MLRCFKCGKPLKSGCKHFYLDGKAIGPTCYDELKNKAYKPHNSQAVINDQPDLFKETNMKFDEMLIKLRLGGKFRRKDWGYFPDAHILIHDFYGSDFVYIINSINSSPEHVITYGFTLIDIDSLLWEETK